MKFLNIVFNLVVNFDLVPNFDDLAINVSDCDLWLDLHNGRD